MTFVIAVNLSEKILHSGYCVWIKFVTLIHINGHTNPIWCHAYVSPDETDRQQSRNDVYGCLDEHKMET